ncbi:MAG: hypothetical protein K8R36_15500 [Planctomycetales bacterium]|nr:hypothetical protein [Planctomycetales bacterium]
MWEVPPETPADSLYDRLEKVVSPALPAADDRRLPMADSKVLYKAGCGLEVLERSVLCALAISGCSFRKWRELWTTVVHQGERCQRFESLPWHVDFDLDVPVDAAIELITLGLQHLEEGLAAANVRLLTLSASAVFPQEFNKLVLQTDSKGEALSLTTLRLVERLLNLLPEPGNVQITCDKHGGRDRYAALIQHVFPDSLLNIRREGRDESIYRIVHLGRQVDFHFTAKGERLLPTALASMLAKYLRELAMKPFNGFWQRHIPGLRATAGYPEDAIRFRGEIAEMQKQLGITDEILWRCR